MYNGLANGYLPSPINCENGLQTIFAFENQKEVSKDGSVVRFQINAKEFSISEMDANPSQLLASFIRETALLKGTKIMCHEGGCGACLVTAKLPNGEFKAVNSCLTPVLSVDGWEIFTVEYLGNQNEGYNKIQQKVVYHSGTQCGFCTPGMVMNMHSLLKKQDGKVTVEDIENGFDGNICRCTGYRSILDSMKSLAVDSTNKDTENELGDQIIKLKDAGCCGAPGNGQACCRMNSNETPKISQKLLRLKLGNGNEWIQPKDLTQLYEAMKEVVTEGKKYRFVAGNTGSGVYPPPNADVTIDITALPLDEVKVSGDYISIGATTPLTKLIDFLSTLKDDNFNFAGSVAKHIRRVASTPVRNRGTVAGNLCLKRLHNEFPSDIFTILECLGTAMVLGSSKGDSCLALIDFLKADLDMSGKVVLGLCIPKRPEGYQYRSYKISKRFQNAHAYVNAAFLFQLDANFNVLQQPRICLAGINNTFVHATETEKVLVGKSLASQQDFDGALEYLEDEIIPDNVPGEASPVYRKTLAKALFYKAVLSILGDKASEKMRSGGINLDRPPSSGVQTFDKDSSHSPLYKPVRKIEAIYQTSGEAEYIADIPKIPGELFGLFLLSKVSNATLKSIDASQALKIPGVTFLKYDDIPGTNNYMEFGIYGGPPPDKENGSGALGYSTLATAAGAVKRRKIAVATSGGRFGVFRSVSGVGGGAIFKRLNEFAKLKAQKLASRVYSARGYSATGETTPSTPEIFASTQEDVAEDTVFVKDKISYYGQALGLVVAESREMAYKALSLIKVEYAEQKRPKLNLHQLYCEAKANDSLEDHNVTPGSRFEVPPKTSDLPFKTISGSFKNGSQYHYHMELQSCLCVPREENSMDVYAGTQWMEHTQYVVASVLDIPHHNVNVQVRRLGGGFGAKLTRNSALVAAAALAAKKTGKPVRISLTMEENMTLIGKRTEYLATYDVGVNANGKILTLSADISCGTGFTKVESDNAGFCIPFVQNAYAVDGWSLRGLDFMSNVASNTSTRGPGSANGIAIIEYIMDHIAFVLNKSPLEVRAANYAKEGDRYIVAGDMKEENAIPEMMDKLLKDNNYVARRAEADKFNLENRWKKRGLSAMPVKFLIEYLGARFSVFVAILHFDGTVVVSHPGIEMGQGVNTKVAQTVAYALGIPLHFVKIKPSNNLTGANSFLSGASFTSELCCYGAMRACEILKDRMAPIKATCCPDDPWKKLVQRCYQGNVDLNASYLQNANDQVGPEPITGTVQYPVWIVCLTEVEIDVLTGENRVVRVDILQDVGRALSPEVDIGQIEGGYVMGLGLYTTEQLIWDENTGELLTKRSWDYKPPQSRCIPQDFRITILPKADNPFGVLGSKTTGEPTLTASFGAVLAIKDAISAARRDAGNRDWFQLNTPVTPEDIVKLSQVNGTEYKL